MTRLEELTKEYNKVDRMVQSEVMHLNNLKNEMSAIEMYGARTKADYDRYSKAQVNYAKTQAKLNRLLIRRGNIASEMNSQLYSSNCMGYTIQNPNNIFR